MQQQIIISLYILTPLVVILSMYFFYSYQALKEIEIKKMQLLYAEIIEEREKASKIKNNKFDIKYLDKSLKDKIIRIKIHIFNLDFTLNEIF